MLRVGLFGELRVQCFLVVGLGASLIRRVNFGGIHSGLGFRVLFVWGGGLGFRVFFLLV